MRDILASIRLTNNICDALGISRLKEDKHDSVVHRVLTH